MSEELKGNGHCETVVVDDEPTEGVSGERVGGAVRPRAGRPARRAHPSLPAAMLLLLEPHRARARQQGALDRDVVLGDAPSRRDGHPPGASLGRRADRAQGPRGDRLGGVRSRPLQQPHHRRRHPQSPPPRGPRQARARSRPDLVPGRRCRERRADRRLSRRHAEEARRRPLGDRAWPAADHQRPDPPPEHPQCRPLYRACRQARRAAARNRPCAILRLGLSQSRRADPDL